METWIQERQASGVELFASQGWPTRSLEAWKTTPIKTIVSFGSDALSAPNPSTIAAADSAVQSLGTAAGPRLVLVAGHLVESLSTLGGLDLASTNAGAHLGVIASTEKGPLVALSACALGRALVIRAAQADNEVVEVVHVGVSGPGGAQTRLLVEAKTSEEVTVVERFIDLGDAPCWSNVVTEVAVGPNAQVQHVQILQGGAASSRTGNLSARVDRDGRFTSHVVSLSGCIARSEVLVQLAGDGSSCCLEGLYVASGESVLDHYTEVEHIARHTSSDEVYRGVIADKATAGFVGRVLIHEGAIKSETHQLNNNLLLSPAAVVHTRPQLEIDNDDVVATHGSTVGQLDGAAVFYLRSRGLNDVQARSLITWAFVKSQIDRLPTASLREVVSRVVAQQLRVDPAWSGVGE